MNFRSIFFESHYNKGKNFCKEFLLKRRHAEKDERERNILEDVHFLPNKMKSKNLKMMSRKLFKEVN